MESSSSTPTPPVMNWEPLSQRILSDDPEIRLAAVQELRNTTIPSSNDLPLLLSVVLPSILPLLTSKTAPTSDTQSTEHQLRSNILAWISKLPTAESVRRYTPALVAVSLDVLRKDYEENAVAASRILFSIYKNHRSLPNESVEPYLKFVLALYQDLPKASKQKFSTIVPSSKGGDAMETSETPATLPQSTSLTSFRVLAECPLVVYLIFQLYPQYSKSYVPVLIKFMVGALDLRPPFHSALSDLDKPTKRLYVSALRDLVTAQAKTLSFLTFFLRTFTAELQQYDERLTTNVVAILTTCPRESIATRRELLVATRHLLNSDFRSGFARHIDSLLDERVLTGHRPVLKPLAYLMLADLVHHTRSSLSMPQMSRVVGVLCRVVHDTALPTNTQHVVIRTLLNLVELILPNTDPNPQLGRDMLVQMMYSLVEKLQGVQDARRRNLEAVGAADIPGLIRVIVIGYKTVVQHLARYRTVRTPPATTTSAVVNEEVASAHAKITHTELRLLRRYFETALPALRMLDPPEFQKETLPYFAAAFTALDGVSFRRVFGGYHIEMLVDAIVLEPSFMAIPRQLLGSNATTSMEFCWILLDFLVERMELLCWEPVGDFVFLDDAHDPQQSMSDHVKTALHRVQQQPQVSVEARKKTSSIYLLLFERILKSLSVYPKNETAVRHYLKRIVSSCLRLSVEKIGQWPENYCMLLRYNFRSISAGKFEDSYKELLPLIPTVLNGLYRIIGSSEDTVLRNTAIELCLTIPARLSSLLPHMNLLLRIIIPALDSNVSELVNLG